MSLDIREIDTPVQFTIPRDGKGRPMIVPPEGGRPVAHTRMSSFIDVIEDKTAISDWKQRSTLLGAAIDPAILDEVRALDKADEKYKDKLNALAERALATSGANEKSLKGTQLHELTELVDQGKPLPDGLSEQDRLDMAEYRMLTMLHEVTFSSIERFVVVPEMVAGGTPDRICRYCGPGPDRKPIEGEFIWDLKTGTLAYGGLKMAAQLAGYSRGRFYDPRGFNAPPYAKHVAKKEDPEAFEAWKKWKQWTETEFTAEHAAKAYSPIPEVNQDWGIIFNLPSGTSEGGFYWADLRVGWEAMKLAVTIREMRALKGKALIPFAA